MRTLLVVTAVLSLAACGQKPDPQADKLAKVEAELAAAKAKTAELEAQVAAKAGPNPTPVAADPVPDPVVTTPAPTPISLKDMGRVCRATVGAVMGRSPGIISVTKTEGNIVQIRYKRDDGTVWKNQCRIDGSKVTWRTVDAFGPGSGIGRWRDEDDIQFRVEHNGKIWIRYAMGSEVISEDSYPVR